MTGIDWLIVAFTALMALYGYGQGFLVGALSLGGFVTGAIVGTRVGPMLLSEGAASPYAPLFGLFGALAVGGMLALGLEGVAHAMRGRLTRWGTKRRGLAALDGLLGAGLIAVVGLGISWVVGAIALQTPAARQLRDDIQRSQVLRRLNAALPPSGPILNALARFDPFPRVQGPSPSGSRPDAAIASDPQVRGAGEGVVRILGTACGLGVQGSGWVAGPTTVVTNAHVVAGVRDAVVTVEGEGDRLEAQAVHFDPRNDLAVLRVGGLPGRPLTLAADPSPGTSGAVLGFPGNGDYDVSPARLGRTVTALSQDAYGRGPLSRRITVLRGRVREGNSGGPMVDGSGRVVTTVFAATVGARTAGGYGVPNAVVRRALRSADGPTGTGPCA
jgi:S1-C subfamily serine protease